jgi:hypothetical protein
MTAPIIVLLLALGLVLDQTIELWGQIITSIFTWVVFLVLAARAQGRERIALFACIAYATAGELFLSLGWGLYTYRLDNVPPFVPPGHALLFMLGMIIAKRLNDAVVWLVPVICAPYLAFAAYAGFDTLGLPLFAMFVLCLLSGEAKKLYATMFALSLVFEIYGTWLGNWRWLAEVPWFGLTSTNPPTTAGAFYCVLDFLVVATVAALAPQRADGAIKFAADASASRNS